MKITENYLGISRTLLVDTEIPGPTTAIFSGIHGDEVSGMRAVEAFLSEIRNGKTVIENGRVVFLLAGNERAVKANKRYVEHNLNRELRKDLEDDGSYERSRGRELMKLLDTVDSLLDLHSTSGPSIPFLFSEKKNVEFAKKLGTSHAIVGWNDLPSDSTAGDTESYMNDQGKTAFTFEAWNHDHPNATETAGRMLRNFLTVTGQLNGSHFTAMADETKLLSLDGAYVCQTGAFEFRLESFENFSEIREGTLIGIDGTEEIRAEKDFILIMPNLTKVKKGEDVFFYWSPLHP